MSLTISSILTSIIISVPFLLFQSLMLRFLNKSKLISPQFLNVIAILFIIRMLFPFEFFYTITIPSDSFFPYIRDFLLGEFTLLNFSVLNLLMFIWVVGSVFNIIKLFRTYNLLIKVVNNTTRTFDNPIDISHEFNKAQIKLIKGLPSPCVVGLFKPTILLPDTLFNEKELTYILKHEYLHVSRMDLFIKFFYEILIAVYWWNPIMYVFRKQLTHIIELNVDHELTNSFTDAEKLEYIELLLKVQTQQPVSIDTSGFFSYFSIPQGETLLHRSNNILIRRKFYSSPVILIVLISLGLYLSTSIVFEPYYEQSDLLNNTLDLSSDSSFLIPNSTGGFDLFIDDMFINNIENTQHEAFESIPIYNSASEVK